MATSRYRTALNDIVTEFETISTANGFNTDPVQVIETIRHPDDITTFPEIGIELGAELVTPVDSAWTHYDATIPVMVVGAIKADTDVGGNGAVNLEAAAEDMRQDLKRVIATTISKYLVTFEHQWNISPKLREIEIGSLGGEGIRENVAVVGAVFDIVLRDMNASFSGVRDYLFSSTEVYFHESDPPYSTSEFSKED